MFYQHLLHPFWILCSCTFIIHQITQKLFSWNLVWIDSYLDPLLCMPILLGLILAERRFILRNNKVYTFSFFEILVITFILGIIFEEGFPTWSNQFTKDYLDYIFYFVGALLFYFLINKIQTYEVSKNKK